MNQLRLTPIVKNLLIVNVIIFFVLNIVAQTDLGGVTVEAFFLDNFFLYKSDLILERGTNFPNYFLPVQLVTHFFTHLDLMHLVFNMIFLVFLGPPVEGIMGSKKFLGFYLFSGVVGGALLAFLDPMANPVLGASGALSGVLAAFAYSYPYQRIHLMFLFPIEARMLALGMAGYSAVMIIAELRLGSEMMDNVSHFGHLMGMAAALIYFYLDKYLPLPGK